MAPWDTCSQRKVDRLSFELRIIILKYRIIWEHDCTWCYSKDVIHSALFWTGLWKPRVGESLCDHRSKGRGIDYAVYYILCK